MKTHRRDFLKYISFGIPGLLLNPVSVFGQKKEKPPAYDPALVKEFVVAGHKDLPKVKSMLSEYPNLLNCTWDWGGGDFETAIGGAGHMGDVEIANFLIAQGARVNVFVLTMLGKTELVKPILDAYPNLIFAKGPHGYTLLHHAKKGGDTAADLLQYLTAKGLTENSVPLYHHK
ncbi:MAG: ankyrin repeat domain-containing protein [Calditrichae bacterium]|nr:ankyrin repeat domain-containing protein [Calditrichia bacterium]